MGGAVHAGVGQVVRRAGVVPGGAAVAGVEDGLETVVAAGAAHLVPGVGRRHDLVRVVRIDHDLDLTLVLDRGGRGGRGGVAVGIDRGRGDGLAQRALQLALARFALGFPGFVAGLAILPGQAGVQLQPPLVLLVDDPGDRELEAAHLHLGLQHAEWRDRQVLQVLIDHGAIVQVPLELTLQGLELRVLFKPLDGVEQGLPLLGRHGAEPVCESGRDGDRQGERQGQHADDFPHFGSPEKGL
jgi:hypothetical protein